MVRNENSNFERLVRKFDPQATLLSASPLTGGVSAQVTLLEVEKPDGHTQKMIVRQHGERDRQQNPHIAADEFRLLQILQSAGIPAAKPYYVDESDEIFPTPYVVVEYIEGKPNFSPADVSDFAQQFAAYLARLHQLDVTTFDLSFLPDQTAVQTARLQNRPAKLDNSIDEGRIRDILERAWPLPQRNKIALLHGDFWPGNAIWRGEQLIAMIDWEDAALGDPRWDLAVSRLDLLWALGIDAMNIYTQHYQSLNPIDFTDLPYWDLCVALRPANQISNWAQDDAAKIRMRERHHLFVEQAIEKLRS